MDQPFFILGTGRCGSSWVYQLLSRHPRVALTNEAKVVNLLWFMSDLAALPADQRRSWNIRQEIELRGMLSPVYAERFGAVFRDHLRPLLEDFYRRCYPDRDFTHWGDQLPDPQAARAVQELWPNTRFVLLVRDPRDVWCSYRSFAGREEIARRYPQLAELDARQLGILWRNLNGSCADWLRPLHVQRYEELVADPAGTLTALLDFLGLPPDPAVDAELQEQTGFRGHGTAASPEQSVARWRSELDAAEVAAIEDACGATMARFGYAPAG